MRRALALLALAAAAVLAALSAAAPDTPQAGRIGRSLPCGVAGGKPLAPLEVTLEASPATGSVPVSFTIRPLIEMQSVRWEWELSPGLVVVDGAMAGEAGGVRDAITDGRATVSVPWGGYGRATLRVSGTFLGRDAAGNTAPETVRVESAFTWGTAPAPTDEVLSPDLETGVLRPVAVVPVTWEPR
jgi:hypothetical protein